jgi:hypothetical protein
MVKIDPKYVGECVTQNKIHLHVTDNAFFGS